MSEQNVTAEQHRKYIEELRVLQGALGNLTRTMDRRSENLKSDSGDLKKEQKGLLKSMGAWTRKETKGAQKFDKHLNSVSDKFDLLGKDASNAAYAFQNFVKGFLGGAVLGQLTVWFRDLNTNYRSLAEAGVQFSGGLLDMSRSAAQAGVTLEQYTDMMQRNSKVVAQLGDRGGGFAKLAADVRRASEQFGLYGYTMEGLNEMTGEYMETMRLQGRLRDIDHARAANSIRELAEETSALSAVTGKSRKEIMADSQAAQRNSVYMAKLMGMGAQEAQKYNDTMGKAITALAAQPGQAGKMLADMLADSAGMGTAIFGESARTFVQAGMGHVVGMMDELKAGVEAGTIEPAEAGIQFAMRLKKEGGKSLESLRIQAAAGNQSAQQVLQILTEISAVSDEEWEERKKRAKQQDALTSTSLALSNVWGRLTGMIRDRFLDVLQRFLSGVTKGLEDFAKSPAYETLNAAINSMGETISRWIGGIDGDATTGIANFVQSVAELTANGLKTLADWMAQYKTLSEALVDVVWKIGQVAAAWYALKGIAKLAGGLFSAKVASMSVKAGIVNINDGGGMFDRFGRRGRRGGRRGGGRGGVRGAGGIGAAGDIAGEIAEHGGKGLKWAKGGLKGLGVIGAIYETIGAGQEVMDLMKQRDEGLLDDKQFRDELIRSLVPRLGGSAGAWALGTMGASAGAVGGPIGALLGGMLGGTGGYFGGDYIAEMLVERMLANQPEQLTDPLSPNAAQSAQPTDPEQPQAPNIDERIQNAPQRETQVQKLIDEVVRLREEVQKQTAIIAGSANEANRAARQALRVQGQIAAGGS